jgi:hypothetical protein
MTEPTIPTWLIAMGYEAGDDLADFDAFECERCSVIGDIGDSIEVEGDCGRELVRPACAD